MWVIYAVHLQKYLHDKMGWISGEHNATRYSQTEKVLLSGHMPFGGVWHKAKPLDEKLAGFRS